MIKTLLLTLLIVAVAMVLFCVKLLFKKNGRFSSQHVHDNPALRKWAFIVLWTKTARQGIVMGLIRK